MDGAPGKAELDRMTVLSLMAVYLVLAVAVGVARNHVQVSGAGAQGAVVAQTGGPHR